MRENHRPLTATSDTDVVPVVHRQRLLPHARNLQQGLSRGNLQNLESSINTGTSVVLAAFGIVRREAARLPPAGSGSVQ
jgi:hypothetical protein